MSRGIGQKCQSDVVGLQRKSFTIITTISQAKNQAETLVGGNLELSSSKLVHLNDLITVEGLVNLLNF